MSKQLSKSKSLKTKLEERLLHVSLCAYNRYALDKSSCISKAGMITINRTMEDAAGYLLTSCILYEKFFAIARHGISNIKEYRHFILNNFLLTLMIRKMRILLLICSQTQIRLNLQRRIRL